MASLLVPKEIGEESTHVRHREVLPGCPTGTPARYCPWQTPTDPCPPETNNRSVTHHIPRTFMYKWPSLSRAFYNIICYCTSMSYWNSTSWKSEHAFLTVNTMPADALVTQGTTAKPCMELTYCAWISVADKVSSPTESVPSYYLNQCWLIIAWQQDSAEKYSKEFLRNSGAFQCNGSYFTNKCETSMFTLEVPPDLSRSGAPCTNMV